MGSSPIRVAISQNIRGFSSFGRAPPCQGGGGGFEPRNPLQRKDTPMSVFSLFLERLGASQPPSTSPRFCGFSPVRSQVVALRLRSLGSCDSCSAHIASPKTVDNCFSRSDCAETRSIAKGACPTKLYDYVSRGEKPQNPKGSWRGDIRNPIQKK